MNYPYPRFFLDVQLAKRRLAQVLAPEQEVPRDSIASPIAGSAPVTHEHRETAGHCRMGCFVGRLAPDSEPGPVSTSGSQGRHSSAERRRQAPPRAAGLTRRLSQPPYKFTETSPTRSERSNSDMTPFCFTLALVLIGTVAAAHTDRPVFWLLAGPFPLVAGFMAIVFFRQGFGRHGPGPTFGAAGRRKRDHRNFAQHISSTKSCRMMQKSG